MNAPKCVDKIRGLPNVVNVKVLVVSPNHTAMTMVIWILSTLIMQR